MNRDNGSSPAVISERDRFISDLFHTISQPLTALRCSLELALRKPLSAEDARGALDQALQATERVFESVLYLRQLTEAERPPELLRAPLEALLRELHSDISPVAESMGVALDFRGAEECEILAAPEALSRALFLILDFVLRDLSPGDRISMTVVPGAQERVLQVERRSSRPLSSVIIPEGFDVPPSLRGLTLAARLLSAMGGVMKLDSERGSIEVRLRI